MKLILRGHHLLCLQGFQGYGYDEDFIRNMDEINQIRKLGDTTIQITNEADDICKACPNLKNNLCINKTQNDRITSMDNEVLSKLNSSKEYDALDLFKNIEEIFNSKETVNDICFKCMWHKECLFYQKL